MTLKRFRSDGVRLSYAVADGFDLYSDKFLFYLSKPKPTTRASKLTFLVFEARATTVPCSIRQSWKTSCLVMRGFHKVDS